jgi:hypothetical protein
MHQDRRIQALDVVSRVNHRMPPQVLDVSLERHAERPVIPDRAKAAVNLGGLKHEPAALAE